MTQTWLTVDCDDFRHIPKHYGHPTRSKSPILSQELSPEFKLGMRGFEHWLSTHQNPVTLFVIADSLENQEFCLWLKGVITEYSNRITIGCHGLPTNHGQLGQRTQSNSASQSLRRWNKSLVLREKTSVLGLGRQRDIWRLGW